MDYIHISEIICVFCQKNEDTLQLKTFQEASWETAKNAADRRKSLKSNKHSTATEEIIKAEHAEGYVYHSQCFSQFCEVKRLPSPKSEQSEPHTKSTRSNSNLPATDDRGFLKSCCVFCGNARKRKKGKTEGLHQCITLDGSKAIICAAKSRGDARILSLGEDLIAKVVKYHHSCRHDYLRDVPTSTKPVEQTSNRKIHNDAFQNISVFIQNEVINKQTPMMASAILRMYKEEYKACGGEDKDIKDYCV